MPTGTGGRLDRTLAIDWEEPPSSLLDVEVEVVYRDGTRDRVDEDHLAIVPEGVVVEDYPLEAGKRVLQVEVDYKEGIGPFSQLWDFLTSLDEEYRKTREEFEDWRRERRERSSDGGGED